MFGELCRPCFAIGLALRERGLLAGELLLGLAQLVHRGFQSRAALQQLPPILLARLLLVGQLIAQASQLAGLGLDVLRRFFLAAAFFGELLLFAAQLLAHAFHARAQGGERRLLSLQGGGALGQLVGQRVAFGLLQRQPLPLHGHFGTHVLDVQDLLFQVRGVLLKVLYFLFMLLLARLQGLVALFQRPLQAVQAQEIGLVLRLLSLQCVAIGLQLVIASLTSGELRGHLLFQLRDARLEWVYGVWGHPRSELHCGAAAIQRLAGKRDRSPGKWPDLLRSLDHDFRRHTGRCLP